MRLVSRIARKPPRLKKPTRLGPFEEEIVSIGDAMFLQCTATSIALLLFVFFNGQPAFALCVLGFGNALECRYIAACTKRGASSGSCSCSYKLGQETFPPEQFGAFVEVFEAYADNDHERVKRLQSRLGFGVLEFTARLNTVMNAASAKCGR
jgi:hypothetical protein